MWRVLSNVQTAIRDSAGHQCHEISQSTCNNFKLYFRLHWKIMEHYEQTSSCSVILYQKRIFYWDVIRIRENKSQRKLESYLNSLVVAIQCTYTDQLQHWNHLTNTVCSSGPLRNGHGTSGGFLWCLAPAPLGPMGPVSWGGRASVDQTYSCASCRCSTGGNWETGLTP